MDHDNINFNKNYKVNNIKDITVDFLNENNYTIHNVTNTYHVKQNSISCIDHMYSNCPQNITHVTNHNTGLDQYM